MEKIILPRDPSWLRFWARYFELENQGLIDLEDVEIALKTIKFLKKELKKKEAKRVHYALSKQG